MRTGRKPAPNTKRIIYDGHSFYPTKQGYYIGSVGKRQIKRLHVYVWEKYNGTVPKGYHIHHIDGNKENNDISNLAILSQYDHIHNHSLNPKLQEQKRKNIKKAISEAPKWHKSDAGSEWHKKHWEETTKHYFSEFVVKKCEVCGKDFNAVKIFAYRTKYCGANCKANARRRREGIPVAAFKQREAGKKESL